MVILEGRGGAKNLEGGDRGQVLISTSIKGRDRRQQIWQTASIWSRVAQSSLQMSWRCSIQHQLRLHAQSLSAYDAYGSFRSLSSDTTKSRLLVSTWLGLSSLCSSHSNVGAQGIDCWVTPHWTMTLPLQSQSESFPGPPHAPHTPHVFDHLQDKIEAYIEEHGKHSLRANSWSWRCSSWTDGFRDILAL